MILPLALNMLSNLIVALFILVCVALILIILLQKGRGGGLGAAFGGGGAGSLLGTKTGDFLTWVTISLVAGFLVLAVLMGKFMRPSGTSSTLAPAPAPQVAPVTDTEVDAEETTDVEEVEANATETVEETAEAVTEEVENTDTAPVEEATDAEVTE